MNISNLSPTSEGLIRPRELCCRCSSKLILNFQAATDFNALFYNFTTYNLRSLDPDNSGYITEGKLRKILKGKIGISEEDTEEMITEYKKLGIQQASTENEPIIFYKGCTKLKKMYKHYNNFIFRFCRNAENLIKYIQRFLRVNYDKIILI